MMSQFHAADVVYVRDAIPTTPISGLAEMMPDDLHLPCGHSFKLLSWCNAEYMACIPKYFRLPR